MPLHQHHRFPCASMVDTNQRRIDDRTPHAAGEHVHAIAARSRLSLYEATGHCPFLEQPDRFNTELSEFVRNDCAM